MTYEMNVMSISKYNISQLYAVRRTLVVAEEPKRCRFEFTGIVRRYQLIINNVENIYELSDILQLNEIRYVDRKWQAKY